MHFSFLNLTAASIFDTKNLRKGYIPVYKYKIIRSLQRYLNVRTLHFVNKSLSLTFREKKHFTNGKPLAHLLQKFVAPNVSTSQCR